MKQIDTIIFGLLIVMVNLPLCWGEVSRGLILEIDPILAGQWWRLITHSFVHVSWYHLLLDGVAFFSLYTALPVNRLWKRIVLMLGCAMGTVVAVAIVLPGISATGYCGLSGIDHGLMALYAMMLIKMGRNSPLYRIGQISLAVVLLKSLIELGTGQMVFDFMHTDKIGVPVAASHLGGVVGGLVGYGLLVWLENKKPRRIMEVIPGSIQA